jgi:uncharacterized protein YbjQ (UPF0145 family)
MWELLVPLIPFLLLLALGYGVGSWRERTHLADLARREAAYQDIRVTNLKRVTETHSVRSVGFVSGEAVIASDYFKSFAAQLRNVVGGEVRAFESLMSRARREATLRMLEQARGLGATEVWNLRLATSNIRSGQSRNPAISVEVYAYGTAIVRG